jgi:hypothetical protein
MPKHNLGIAHWPTVLYLAAEFPPYKLAADVADPDVQLICTESDDANDMVDADIVYIPTLIVSAPLESVFPDNDIKKFA